MAYLFYFVSVLGIFLLSVTRENYFLEHFENFTELKSGLMVLFFALLLVGYFLLLRKKQVISEKLLVVVSGIIILFFITPPIFSRDAGFYMLVGRNLIEFYQNPFTFPLNNQLNPWVMELKDIAWLDNPSSYGPFFLVFTLPSAILRLKSIVASIYIYKIGVLGAYLLCIYFFNKLTSKKRGVKNRWLLFALNPAILVHVLIDGHNDIFSTLFLLLSLYLLQIKSWSKGLLAFTASSLIKFNTVIFLPVLWLNKNKFSIFRIIATGLAILFPIMLFFTIYKTYTSTILTFLTAKCIYSCTPFIYLSDLSFGAYAALFRNLVFLVVYGMIFYIYLLKRKDSLRFIFWSYMALLFLNVSWLSPWYLILIIPIGLLIGKSLYQKVTFFLTFYSLFHFFGI